MSYKIDMSHFFFNNPKYRCNHICFERDGAFEVHEKYSIEGDFNHHQRLLPSQFGSPLAVGETVDDAIASAEKLGIKHFDIERVVFQ